MPQLTERERGLLERQELALAGRDIAREEGRAELEFTRGEREAEKIRREVERPVITREPPPDVSAIPLKQEELKKTVKRKKRKKKPKKLRVGRAFRAIAFAKPTAKPTTIGLRRRPSRRGEEPTVREIVTEAVHREPEIPDDKKTDKEILDEFFS